jgi:fructose-bisphosphate aldolase class I
MKAWAGKLANIGAGQTAIGKRARLNGLAVKGAYTDGMEK